MGLSVWHLLILLVIVLLVFGPSRLGDLGKSFGQAMRGFKKGLNEEPEIDVTDSVRHEKLEKSESEDLKEAQRSRDKTRT